jgi:hypothetical protein
VVRARAVADVSVGNTAEARKDAHLVAARSSVPMISIIRSLCTTLGRVCSSREKIAAKMAATCRGAYSLSAGLGCGQAGSLAGDAAAPLATHSVPSEG